MNLTIQNDTKISETMIKPKELQNHESIFSLANGTIGLRGFFEDDAGLVRDDSIYMNHFYDVEPYTYGEIAYGYAKNKQKMLALPQYISVKFSCNDQVLDYQQSKVTNYSRMLDMEQAILEKQFDWELEDGLRLTIKYQRLVSLKHQQIIFQHWEIMSDSACSLKIKSYQQLTRLNEEADIADPRLGGLKKKIPLHLMRTQTFMEADHMGVLSHYQTDASKKTLFAGALHHCEYASFAVKEYRKANKLVFDYYIQMKANESVNFDKICYYSDEAKAYEAHIDMFFDLTTRPFSYYCKLQQEVMADFWQRQGLAIDGDTEALAALRFNLFSLYQHVGKDGVRNICAKGLSGEGYEGHYFWDTEIYILPYFIYNFPDIAKQLLISRYKMLPKAKERATELSYEGALFPWRTIDGTEASAYYPAGTAQVHINADIVYAIEQYYDATKDDIFMREMGLEIVIEIARFFASFVDYLPTRGYVINKVTGPDEYSALVDNNIYTNLMVQKMFRFVQRLTTVFDLRLFGVEAEQIALWEEIGNKIYIHQENGLYAQDDKFFERAPWDFKTRMKRPLLLHYHPMVIYKYNVLKQADITLSTLTCFDFYTDEDIAKIYDYYEPLTTHDSSLSETIHGIIATKLDRLEEGVKYFNNTVKTDLYNLHHNVAAGLHMAAMAGGWQGLVYGFAGMRVKNHVVSFTPKIPKEWQSYSFSIVYQGVRIRLTVSHDDVRVETDQKDYSFELIIHK